MPNVHIKIKDGDIQSQDEVELLSSDDSSSLVPLGSIISIHQSLSSNVSTEHWKVCDGTSTNIILPDGSSHSFTSPDLSDDRFLMGGNGSGNGGHNDGHGHSTENLTLFMDGENIATDSGLGSHNHLVRDRIGVHNWRFIGGVSNAVMLHNQPGTRTTSGPSSSAHSHPVAIDGSIFGNLSGFDGDTVGTNRPKYYKVDFFIRIK